MDLDSRSKMIIFGSILTTFKSIIIFKGRWGGIENWHEPKTKPNIGKFSLPKSVKRSVLPGQMFVVGDGKSRDSRYHVIVNGQNHLPIDVDERNLRKKYYILKL